jgi:hypothetical protein
MNDFERLSELWTGFRASSYGCYKIGPYSVNITSNCGRLANRLTAAFRHIKTKDTDPHFTIRLWSGSKLPLLNWTQILSNGYRGYAIPPLYFHYFETTGALSVVNTEKNAAYYIVRDENSLPWWVDGSPLQVILHVWLREKGMQLTHSASVGDGNKALLLAGKGGSGKSTTVLACLENGLKTLGEDYILLSKDGAYSVYQTAKWQPKTRVLFPSYENQIANPEIADKEKALVFYDEIFPSQLTTCSSLSAVVSLCVGKEAKLEKSDLKNSLQSLLLSTATQLPHPSPRTTQILQELITPVEHYHFSLGPHMRENVDLLRGLLQ